MEVWQIALISVGCFIVVLVAVLVPVLLLVVFKTKTTPTQKPKPPSPSICTWKSMSSLTKQVTGFPYQTSLSSNHLYAISKNVFYQMDFSLNVTKTIDFGSVELTSISTVSTNHSYDVIILGTTNGFIDMKSSDWVPVTLNSGIYSNAVYVELFDDLYDTYVSSGSLIYVYHGVFLKTSFSVAGSTNDVIISTIDGSLKAYGYGYINITGADNEILQTLQAFPFEPTYGQAMSFGYSSDTLFVGSDLLLDVWKINEAGDFEKIQSIEMGVVAMTQCLNYLYVTTSIGSVKEYFIDPVSNKLTWTGNEFLLKGSKTFGNYLSSIASDNKVTLYVSDIGKNQLSLFKCQ